MKQKLQAVLDDDRGVSPVIGVILMVAITVILAAVIGTFVLNLGGDPQSTPQAQLSVELDDTGDTILITHNGGDALNVDDLRVATDDSTGSEFGDGTGTFISVDNDYSEGGQFSVGDEAEVGTPGTGEYTVQLIHEPSESILVEGSVTIS